PLLSMALPFGYHLAALRRYRADLLPLRIALTLETLDDPLVPALLDLQDDGYTILLDVRSAASDDESIGRKFQVIGEETLRVTLTEAKEMAPGAIAVEQVERFWRESDGQFTLYNTAIHRAAGLPRLNVPSSSGPLLP